MANYYYSRAGKQYGPFSAELLKKIAAAGHLRLDDLVWQEGTEQWVSAAKVQGLFPANQGSSTPQPAKMASPPMPRVPTPPNATPVQQKPADLLKEAASQVGTALLQRIKTGLTPNAKQEKLPRSSLMPRKLLLGCGGALALFVVGTIISSLSPSNSGTTSRNGGTTSTGDYWHASGEMANLDLTPPPVKEALQQGRRVWVLLKFKPLGAIEGSPDSRFGVGDGEIDKSYVVFDGGKLESITVVILRMSRGITTGYDWRELYAEKPAVCASSFHGCHFQQSDIWKGRADQNTITLICKSVSDDDDDELDTVSHDTGTVQVAANTETWKATYEGTKDTEYIIRTESDARRLRSTPDLKYSADGKKATAHISIRSECSDKVFIPSAKDIRTMTLPE